MTPTRRSFFWMFAAVPLAAFSAPPVGPSTVLRVTHQESGMMHVESVGGNVFHVSGGTKEQRDDVICYALNAEFNSDGAVSFFDALKLAARYPA